MARQSGPKKEDPRQITDRVYTEEGFQDKDCSGWQFHSVVFQNCRFIRCDFSHARFVNCQFRGCTLERCYFLKAELLYSRFSKCTGNSSNFSLSHLKFTTWSSCTLEYPVFAKTNWENALVQDCRFPEAYFPESALNKTKFLRTDWSKSSFAGTSLSGMDLSSCRMDGVQLSEALSELRGAKISQDQSAEFMRLMGVKITKKDR